MKFFLAITLLSCTTAATAGAASVLLRMAREVADAVHAVNLIKFPEGASEGDLIGRVADMRVREGDAGLKTGVLGFLGRDENALSQEEWIVGTSDMTRLFNRYRSRKVPGVLPYVVGHGAEERVYLRRIESPEVRGIVEDYVPEDAVQLQSALRTALQRYGFFDTPRELETVSPERRILAMAMVRVFQHGGLEWRWLMESLFEAKRAGGDLRPYFFDPRRDHPFVFDLLFQDLDEKALEGWSLYFNRVVDYRRLRLGSSLERAMDFVAASYLLADAVKPERVAKAIDDAASDKEDIAGRFLSQFPHFDPSVGSRLLIASLGGELLDRAMRGIARNLFLGLPDDLEGMRISDTDLETFAGFILRNIEEGKTLDIVDIVDALGLELRTAVFEAAGIAEKDALDSLIQTL